MKKNLKLRAKHIWDGWYALQVVEQNFRCPKSAVPPEFQASNGVYITSAVHPEWEDGYLNVRGSDIDRDKDILLVLKTDLDRISAAIHEFNTHQGKPPEIGPDELLIE